MSSKTKIPLAQRKLGFEYFFLKDYVKFGVNLRLEAAQALARSYYQTQDLNTRKILTANIYKEFVNALEDFAALCLAISQRTANPTLLDTLVSYRVGAADLNEIFRGKRRTQILSMLNLDTRSMWPALKAHGFSRQYIQNTQDNFLRGLKEARKEQRDRKSQYNKIKHAAVIFSEDDPNTPMPNCFCTIDRRRWAMKKGEQPPPWPGNLRKPYQMDCILFDDQQVKLLVKNVEGVRNTMQDLILAFVIKNHPQQLDDFRAP